jgi:hypothetical protein
VAQHYFAEKLEPNGERSNLLVRYMSPSADLPDDVEKIVMVRDLKNQRSAIILSRRLTDLFHGNLVEMRHSALLAARNPSLSTADLPRLAAKL